MEEAVETAAVVVVEACLWQNMESRTELKFAVSGPVGTAPGFWLALVRLRLKYST